jgi:diguanylate cyclase
MPEMLEIKQAVLGHVSKLLESNQDLESNLLYTQYRVQEQSQEIDSARREARTDGLTGVANRKAFDEKLHLSVGAYQREGIPFVLVTIDVDHFKRINDSHGHHAGDRVLEILGDAMREVVREGDFVARLGGDEFAVIFPHTEMEVGYSVAERLHAKVAEETSHLSNSGNQISVGLSIGVAAVHENDTPESIYARADAAMYKSKNRGRNQVQREELEALLA